MSISFDSFLKQAGGTSGDVQVVSGSVTAPAPTPQTMVSPALNAVTKPLQESVKSLGTLYGGSSQGIASKLVQDVQAGAQDIQQGNVVKGIAKAGLRTAGDVAGAIYAPISAVIGATGINKVFDKIGELSQKGGRLNPLNVITDNKAVQDFVMNHPNLEEDFSRAMNIGLGALDKGKIEPKTVIERTAAQMTSNLSKAQAEFKPNGNTHNLVTQYDKLISTGEAQPTDIYTDTNTKTYNPEIAKHIIDDGKAVLIEKGFRNLADKYEKSFTDLNNVTPDQVLQNGLKVTTSEGLAGAGAKIASKTAGAISKDILPNVDRLVNHNVTTALDLTQGDVRNISQFAGHDVGKFIADENLIGLNKDATVKNLKDFYETNYDAVRQEIGKVTKTFTQTEIPRYKDALTEIKKQIADTPGLEKSNEAIDTLLKKQNPTLEDVQRVKELMDEHFSLYKATGDVQQNVTKTGLANVRNDLKNFIEKQVKETTGADIAELNNKVSTARSIMDAAETRSTRGLTRANLKLGDLGVFGIGMGLGGPLGGAALVLGKKILESPSFKLKFSKFLDGVSDARKLKIQQDLEKGIVPKEVKITYSSKASPSRSSELNSSKNQINGYKTTNISNAKNDFINQNKNNVANPTAAINKISKRTIIDIVPPKKGIVKRAVDNFKNTPNKQGGFIKIGPSVIKEVTEATKNELIKAIDYLRLGKSSSNVEDTVSRLAQKYGISEDLSNSQIANKFQGLIEKTKTSQAKVFKVKK